MYEYRRFLATSITFLLLVCAVSKMTAQDELAGQPVGIDGNLRLGMELVTKKKYTDARKQFEIAAAQFKKDPRPSEWLFRNIELKDEVQDDARSSDPQIKAIMTWRHTMGTKQAVAMFLAFATQLEGDKVTADKYFQDIYDLQSPLWGLSWRTFIPPIESLFHLNAPEENSENYAWYLYRAGLLLEDAGEDVALKFFEKAQKIAPKDAEINANLASSYVVRLRASEAKVLALASLEAKPNQARVLIDLATAEWLLGELDNAEKHAAEAAALRPELPGTHITLALIAIVKGDKTKAIQEAAAGVRLSERHPFYLAIQAAAIELNGRQAEADTNIKEAYKNKYPSEQELKNMFLRDKPLELLLMVIKRQK